LSGQHFSDQEKLTTKTLFFVSLWLGFISQTLVGFTGFPEILTFLSLFVKNSIFVQIDIVAAIGVREGILLGGRKKLP